MRRLLVAVLPFSLVACLSSPDDARPPSVAPPADAAITLDAPPDAPDAPLDSPPDAAPASLRVLFVGNSYTFYNDLPGLIARMGAAAEKPFSHRVAHANLSLGIGDQDAIGHLSQGGFETGAFGFEPRQALVKGLVEGADGARNGL